MGARRLAGRGTLKPGALARRPGEAVRYAVRTGLARKVLGWSPRVGLEEGLRRTLVSLGRAP